MRVYLDNCCYNRPFDGQGQLRVAIEPLARLLIQSQMDAERFIAFVSRDADRPICI